MTEALADSSGSQTTQVIPLLRERLHSGQLTADPGDHWLRPVPSDAARQHYRGHRHCRIGNKRRRGTTENAMPATLSMC